jgi:phage baseplate assembly protein W
MTREYQLAWPCPHTTVEESVTLGADRRTLRTQQPVAGAATIRLLVNNEMFIPQAGLYSNASLASAVSGPYELIPDEDTITILTSAGTTTHTFNVPRTTRYTATQIIELLKRANIRVYMENDNGHLVFYDTEAIGPGSRVKVTGTAAGALGFGAPGVNTYQWQAMGKELYPSWHLYTPDDEVTTRFPRFDRIIRGNPIFKATYTTAPNRCLRCGASYVENDLRFDSQGQSLMIENENLLYQAALKVLLTDKGSNPYHPWYGTSLRSRIGSKAVSGVASLISEDIRKALEKFQRLQESQAQYQQVTFKERLLVIQSVDVKRHEQDETTYLIDVTVRNASSQPVSLSIVFTVPSVVALMGSNGLMLGTEPTGVLPQNQGQLFLTGQR